MSTNGINVSEDTEMADCDGEKVVTMMDVLKEQEDFEEDANAVLGASDDKNCTYSKGYVKRQAIYACLTCCTDAKNDPSKWAGVCLACSLACHENHELIELYTKRNFRCDCGNPNFNSHPCQFTPEKSEFNTENMYNQNFSGVYCICHRPYPDPESDTQADMIQCIICEDWLHSNHLDAVVPSNEQYSEMICKACMEKNEFLHDYSDLVINKENMDVDILNTSSGTNSMNNFNANTNSEIIGNENSACNSKFLEGQDIVMEQQSCNKFSGNDVELDLTPSNLTSNEANVCQIVNNKKTGTEQNNYIQPEIKKSEETSQENNDTTLEKPTSFIEAETTIGKTVSIDNHSGQHLEKDSLPVAPNSAGLDHKENINKDAPSKEELIDEKKLESGASDISAFIIKAEIDETKDKINIENEFITDNELIRGRSVNVPITDQSESVSLAEQSENVAIAEQSENMAIEEQSENVDTAEKIDVAATKQSEKITLDQAQSTYNTEQSEDVPTTKLSENEQANIVLNKETSVNVSDSAPTSNQTQDDPSIKESIDESNNTSTIEKSDNAGASTQLDQLNKIVDNEKVVTVSESITVNESNNILEKDKSTDTIMDENNTDSIINKIEQLDRTNSTCDNQLPDETVNTDALKRKLSCDGDVENVGVKKSKSGDSKCDRPRGVNKVHHGATFWPSNFRHRLCTCSECISMYKDLSVLFLIDPEDTVTAYERLGKERTYGKPSSQYEKGMAALSSLGRVQQINALTEYAKLRDKLVDFLKTFKDKKVIVKEEDIKAFFAGMKPVREPDGVYFCR